MTTDDVTVTVLRSDLLYVLDWAEGGLADYNRENVPQVERMRRALAEADRTGTADAQQCPAPIVVEGDPATYFCVREIGHGGRHRFEVDEP